MLAHQSKNDVDGALNKYKLIDTESQKGAEIWNNVGLCFYKKKKFIAVCEIGFFDAEYLNLGISFTIQYFNLGNIVSQEGHLARANQLQLPVQPGTSLLNSATICKRIPYAGRCCLYSTR